MIQSHLAFPYLLLLNVCFLTLVSKGLGGELSHFAIGREWLYVAGPAFLLLAILEGAEVSRGVSPVCSCSYWPAPERCGLKHCGFLTPADLRTPAAWSMCMSSDTRRHKWRWCNVGGTNRALCLSSARIWSLVLRLYLQSRREKKRKGKRSLNVTVNKRQQETHKGRKSTF